MSNQDFGRGASSPSNAPVGAILRLGDSSFAVVGGPAIALWGGFAMGGLAGYALGRAVSKPARTRRKPTRKALPAPKRGAAKKRAVKALPAPKRRAGKALPAPRPRATKKRGKGTGKGAC